MRHIVKSIFSFFILVSAFNLYSVVGKPDIAEVFGKSFFAQHPQGRRQPERLVGVLDDKLVRCDMECFNGVVAATIEYNRSFNGDSIAKYLFFNGTESMIFAGGGTPAANKDVNADNFILANDFYGAVTAKPKYQSAIIDLFFHFNLDEWVCGLYFEAGIPITWTKWELELVETDTNKGTNILANQFGNLETPAPINSIRAGWAGQGINTTTLPLLKDTMNFAKVAETSKTKTSVADLEFVLGYNFLCCDSYHFGINARAVAPTGTRPDGEFFFEPVVGNGHHFMFGGGAWAHFDLWSNGCDQVFDVWLDGTVYTMFRARQKRTFDFTENGIGSRYLLLKKFTTDGTAVAEVVRGPNVTTLDCKVRNAATGQATIIFDYYNCGFTFDVGYSLWGRTHEKINITGEIEKNIYGIKGDTDVQPGGVGGTSLDTASKTKINGENGDVFDATRVFIKTEDLNPKSAEHPSAFSHTIFAHLNYTWEDCDYTPFLGFGGKAEFSGKGNRAFDIWGIWAKGGFTFS